MRLWFEILQANNLDNCFWFILNKRSFCLLIEHWKIINNNFVYKIQLASELILCISFFFSPELELDIRKNGTLDFVVNT